jgi:PKD repeat protein
MPIGIGAAGIAGIAFEQLSPPVLAGSATSGGALTAGTYKYYVTAINANGETTVSNEITITTATTNLTGALTWGAVTGATGYKVYRTAAAGATGTELLIATLGVVLLYNDVAVGSPAGAFPTANTATTPNVYAAPTKFIPFLSESINSTNETVWRRPVRQSADIIGAVAGNYHPEGEFNIEALEDVIIYFLIASRTSVVKTGTTPNFTYTVTPTAAGQAHKTLSLTLVRNGIVFGYTGIVMSSFKFNIDSGLLNFSTNLMGSDEAVQSLPTPTWPTTVPFGAGSYTVEVPTGSTVLDTDTFEFSVEDNAETQFRLKSTGRGAQFTKYGERNSTMTMERDFIDRTDYDLFKSVTAQSITLTASKGANNSVVLLAPVAIKDTYEVSNGTQGDLVRAQIAYQNVIDSSGKSWQITVKTQEDIFP